MIGSVVYALFIVPRALDNPDRRTELQRKAANIGRGMVAFLVVVVAPARLYLQLDAMRFPGEPIWQSLGPLTSTTWSHAWTVQFFALGLAGESLRQFASDRWSARTRNVWLWLGALFSLVVAATIAFSGHANAGSDRGITLFADTVHVFAAGSWVGALFILTATVLWKWSATDDESVALEKRALVQAFSPIALTSAAILAATGFLGALLHLGSVGELFASQYGKALLFKLGAVGLVLLMGFINWKRNTGRIVDDRGAGIRAGALRELAATVLVLLMTSSLVVTPPPID